VRSSRVTAGWLSLIRLGQKGIRVVAARSDVALDGRAVKGQARAASWIDLVSKPGLDYWAEVPGRRRITTTGRVDWGRLRGAGTR
jgi:hypothetical protein